MLLCGTAYMEQIQGRHPEKILCKKTSYPAQHSIIRQSDPQKDQDQIRPWQGYAYFQRRRSASGRNDCLV